MSDQAALIDIAVNEGAQAVASAWRQLPQRMRTNKAISAIVLGVMVQMKAQRPEWFNGLSAQGKKELAADLINAAKQKINGGPL